MTPFPPKIVLFLVLMVCGTSIVTSNSNVTTCSCYGFYKQNITGRESETKCNESGGHLVTMETEGEWKFINSEIQNRSTHLDEWYIGLKKESNAWKWVNNKKLTIDKWQKEQPSGDGKCVVMAKNYPNASRGLWNDVSCDKIRHGFICEYDQERGKSNSSKVPVCFEKEMETPKSTKRSVPTTACTMSDPDQFSLVYVVIALGILLAGGIGFYIYIFYCKDRNSGFLLRCQKYRSCEFKARTSVQMEEGTTPLQNEPTTETEIEDNSNKTDRENSAVLENPAQDTVEDAVNPDYTLLNSPPSSTSTYAALYSSVDIEQKKPEENEDTAPPKMPSPYHKVTEEPAVYATIDKSKKTNKGAGSHVEVVYSKVDKTQKRRKSEDNS